MEQGPAVSGLLESDRVACRPSLALGFDVHTFAPAAADGHRHSCPTFPCIPGHSVENHLNLALAYRAIPLPMAHPPFVDPLASASTDGGVALSQVALSQ